MTVIVDSERPPRVRDRAERIECMEAKAISLGIELHAAAKSGEAGRIALLVRHGANLQARMPDGRTPLHAVARCGRSASIEALLEAGAKPNVTDDTGITPLHLAAITGDAASIIALVEAGADRTALDDEGLAPIDVLPAGVPVRVRQALNPAGNPADTKGETR